MSKRKLPFGAATRRDLRYDLKLWIAHPFEGAAYLPS